jgi:L-seryl-tRNA(Ser) seleniumtransferase
MSTTKPDLRSVPSVTRLLECEEVTALLQRYPRGTVVRAVRNVLAAVREEVVRGGVAPAAEAVAATVPAALAAELRPGLCRVINATGIVAHTALGRSVLPADALAAIADEARGYCLLQIDRATQGRSRRDQFCVDLICELTGAEDATVVNNNAAATMLVLNTLAEGKEVVLSRGQMVEIGGAFRIPDVLRRSGAILHEIGCTNKTHLRDYEEAINDHTGLLMKIHTSNYRIRGFTKEVPIEELVAVGQRYGIPVMDDLGAGALIDLRYLGFPEEPLVKDSIACGADVVSISSDKLIGGPQGGIILGRKEVITRIRKNPLARALRVGKLTLIALEATLKYFLDTKRVYAEHPTTRMLTMPLDELKRRAKAIAGHIGDLPGATIEVVEETSEVGSGSYPAHQIATFAVAVTHQSIPAEEIAHRLRMLPLPVFARVKKDRLLLDPRTVQDGEEPEAAAALVEALSQ